VLKIPEDEWKKDGWKFYVNGKLRTTDQVEAVRLLLRETTSGALTHYVSGVDFFSFYSRSGVGSLISDLTESYDEWGVFTHTDQYGALMMSDGGRGILSRALGNISMMKGKCISCFLNQDDFVRKPEIVGGTAQINSAKCGVNLKAYELNGAVLSDSSVFSAMGRFFVFRPRFGQVTEGFRSFLLCPGLVPEGSEMDHFLGDHFYRRFPYLSNLYHMLLPAKIAGGVRHDRIKRSLEANQTKVRSYSMARFLTA